MSEPSTEPTANVLYTGAHPEDLPSDRPLPPIPGPAVQWFLRVRDRLEAHGQRITMMTRGVVTDGAGAWRVESENFVLSCPVAGCGADAWLFWDNTHPATVREGRRKVVRQFMAAWLRGRCQHTEAEMLAALGADLAPFPPHAVADGRAR